MMKTKSVIRILVIALLFLGAAVFVLFETVWKHYAVSYCFDSTPLCEERILKGKPASPYESALPGMRIIGWVDSTGAEAVPEETIIRADTVFNAVAYPVLDLHKCYLFADDNGFVYPDGELSPSDMSKALGLLLNEDYQGAADLLAQLPQGDGAVRPEDLKAALSKFFSESELSKALSDNALGSGVSRKSFAHIINKLCSHEGENVSLNSGAVAQLDLNPDDAFYFDMLEASVDHTVSADGDPWADFSHLTGRKPGPFLIDGSLYCIGEDGYLLRDVELNTLYYGIDGKYTSGDEEIDSYVTDVISRLCKENPDADQFTLLRCAYDYMIDEFNYVGGESFARSARDWEIEAAKPLFRSGLGNCFNYAAGYWALARGLGYPADTMIYPLDSVNGNHAWNEIEIDGEVYIFDAMLEDMQDNDRFMLSYGKGTGRIYTHVTHWWLLNQEDAG